MEKSFFCIKEKDLQSEKDNHLIYKLHQVGSEFVWVAMWNTYSFMKEREKNRDLGTYKKWLKIQEPIKYALENGYRVIRGDSHTIDSIKWATRKD